MSSLVADRDLVVVCGPGGVGKTTTAAALGVNAVLRSERKVLVLTVDPARRLAQALGLSEVGNAETPVSADGFALAGRPARGELTVAMLDTKAGWDDVIRSHAPDAATRDAILDNSLYQNIAGRFIQSHDYVAMERLHQLREQGRYDLIVIDTPPTRSAIDFLEAPARMAEFFSSRLLRWLTAPYRSRAMGLAAKPFTIVADRVLGADFLADVGEFFVLFQSLYDGFVARSQEVAQVLADDRTTFAVVATVEAAACREAQFFLDELADRDLEAGIVVMNRMLPAPFRSTQGVAAARHILDGDSRFRALAQQYLDRRGRATSEQERLAALAPRVRETARVPELVHDLVDIGGIAEVGDHLSQ
ncbi:MAG: AAA family ATPase [Acidimicrobiia bacterium]|nr:AAA family ATPase [Acidimicrobiia bacterium]